MSSPNLSVQGAAHPGSLASAAVVERQVRDFYGRVLQANTEEDVVAAVHHAADVFGGIDPAFPPNPAWSGRAGLLQALHARLGIPMAFEVDMLRQAFAKLATEAFGVVKGRGGEKAIDRLILYTTSLLVGTVDVLYPGGLEWRHGPRRPA